MARSIVPLGIKLWVALTSALVVVVGIFTATPVFAQDTIHSCVNDSNGRLRIMDPGAPCDSGWSPLDWNIQGVPGADGISGYEVVETVAVIPGYTILRIEATCPVGKNVLGGGYKLLSGGGFLVFDSGPSLDGTYWEVNFWSQSEEPNEISVRAICAIASP